MAACVSVLQLDTRFPRIPGDVSCPETYLGELEILRIPKATVDQVVSTDPASIPIKAFERAVKAASGDVIVTSCGFLSYWQDHLQALTPKPFISASLTALESLCARYDPKEILTLTFDAGSLNEQHCGAFKTDVVGLSIDMQLRRVIAENRTDLDVGTVTRELCQLVADYQKPHHRHVLLECTNLPPYKDAIGATTGLPMTDILTCIERIRPNTIQPAYLTHQGNLP